MKKNRADVIKTIQEITKIDEFTINHAIEACQDSEGRYSMDQVLNFLMDEVIILSFYGHILLIMFKILLKNRIILKKIIKIQKCNEHQIEPINQVIHLHHLLPIVTMMNDINYINREVQLMYRDLTIDQMIIHQVVMVYPII